MSTNPAHDALLDLLYSGKGNVAQLAESYRRMADSFGHPLNRDAFNLIAAALDILVDNTTSEYHDRTAEGLA
jgi:hypothetical protein